MRKLLTILFYITIISQIRCNFLMDEPEAKEVCYDDYGCFNDAPPFNGGSFMNYLPDSPSTINTKFYLYDENADSPQSYEKDTEITSVKKNSLFVLFHDCTETHNAKWIKGTIDNFMPKKLYTFLVVDWENSCSGLHDKKVGNGRLVAVQTAKMVHKLTQLGVTSIKVIGVGLGAQIAALSSFNYTQISTKQYDLLIALSPDEDDFKHNYLHARLDKSDAKLVVTMKVTHETDIFHGFEHEDDDVVEQEHYLIDISKPEMLDVCIQLLGEESDNCPQIFMSHVFLKSQTNKCTIFESKSKESFLNGDYTNCGENCKDIGMFIQNDMVAPEKPTHFYSLMENDEPYCETHYKLEISFKHCIICFHSFWSLSLTSGSYSYSSSVNHMHISSNLVDKNIIINSLSAEHYSGQASMDSVSEFNDLINQKVIAKLADNEELVNEINQRISKLQSSGAGAVSHQITMELSTFVPQFVVFNGIRLTNMKTQESFAFCGSKLWMFYSTKFDLTSNDKEEDDCVSKLFDPRE